MMSLRLLLVPMVLLLASAAAAAVDLTKIERRIVREPAYRNKPKYCLLVFGPEAKTRVWLVQDGAALYVDRNGNGDLTEAGEKVVAENSEDAVDGVYSFKAGDIFDGARRHKELRVYVNKLDRLAEYEDAVATLLKKDPSARSYLLLLEVDMPGQTGGAPGGRVQQRTSQVGGTGVLHFAETPRTAPILHFGGPWQVRLFSKHRLTIDREDDVVLGVGSPGLGSGTFTWIDYEKVLPTDKYPTVDILYPPKRSGESSLRERYELKERC